MSTALERHAVQETGLATGQPIVFAHGYGCDQAMWRFVAPAFADDYRVIVFDHMGFGRSDRSSWSVERYTGLDAYADDLLGVLHELDAHDVVFVGHSVASMIGVLAANKEPDRFARLVLVAPSARYIDDPATGYRGGFSAEDIGGMLAGLDDNQVGWSAQMAPVIMGNSDRAELAEELEASFCRTDPEVARAFARATFLADNRADLPHVRVPALVLQCAEDAVAPEAVGRYVHEHVPGSELVHLDATGHCPNLSAPDEVVAVIRGYLPPP